MKAQKRLYLWWLVIAVILAVGFTVAILNRQWIYDWWRGMNYEATGEMAQIRQDLKLTDKGMFLFNAAQPSLSGQDEFNAKCRTVNDAEIAVLGCYTEGDIYVYNINSAELDGIKELTSAHELLHVVWARMSEDERATLSAVLAQVLRENRDLLEEELATYDVSEQQEELFVRAGTEVKNLPAELEKLYAEIFINQDRIVDFYESYISVFRAIEAEMTELKSEMDNIQAEIDAKTMEYEQRVRQLNANIASFNACAETAGCFKSESDFYSRRSALLAEQESLDGLYNEINYLVSEYNARVEEYNADVTRTEKLNNEMNSSVRVEGI